MLPQQPKLPEIKNFLRKNATQRSEYPEYKIRCLRNVTIETIKPFLEYDLFHLGFNGQVKFGGFDMVLQDTSVLTASVTDCDALAIVLSLRSLSPPIWFNFTACTKEQIDKHVHNILTYCDSVITQMQSNIKIPVFWFGFELPSEPAFGVGDFQSDHQQWGTIRHLNRELQSIISNHNTIYFIEMVSIQMACGARQFEDLRYWHLARAPYSSLALAEFSKSITRIVRVLKQKTKKCLIVDCDNTLWGGVVGEEGVQGIKLGPEYPGSAFVEFQQELLNLYHRGIILCLCSKNNEQDVWNVFQQNSNMVLQEKHISAHRINWRNKPDNITELAEELNIGINHVVFLDDSPFEVDQVNKLVPEIDTLLLDSSNPTSYRHQLQSLHLFDSTRITIEDRQRGTLYRQDAKRKIHRNQYVSVEEYLKSLNMEIYVDTLNEDSVPRAAQLSERTNQFNLTNVRFTEVEMRNFISDPNLNIILASVKDKFGEMGIVGMSALRIDSKTAKIEAFMISCRVLGRKIETVFLDELLVFAKDKGADKILGKYIPSDRNQQTEMFYKNHHFSEEPVGTSDVKMYSKELPSQSYSARNLFMTIEWVKHG